jgi:leucyl-tRNA synthetase
MPTPIPATTPLRKKALADERVKKFIEDRPVKKVIVVKKKLVNIVI